MRKSPTSHLKLLVPYLHLSLYSTALKPLALACSHRRSIALLSLSILKSYGCRISAGQILLEVDHPGTVDDVAFAPQLELPCCAHERVVGAVPAVGDQREGT